MGKCALKTRFILDMTANFSQFPIFSSLVDQHDLENVLPGASDAEINAIEMQLGIDLPQSYKTLLKTYRVFWLKGGSIQFDKQHPFFHHFPPLMQLSLAQQAVVSKRGGTWPPPPMVCCVLLNFLWKLMATKCCSMSAAA